MAAVGKTYNTRQKRKSDEPTLKSRVDWKRTKRDSVSQILDSDESFASEEEELEETDEESDDGSDELEGQADETTLSGEEGRIRRPRLKSKSATIDSDSSSDSDGPGEKVIAKRSQVINDNDSDEDVKSSDDEETKTQIKKQKRLEALKQLAEKQRSRNRTTSPRSTEESPPDVYAILTPETLSESEDSDDLSNFIVQDEEEEDDDGYTENPTSGYKKLFRKHHIPLSASHDLSSHLQKVINAFLINIIDKKFLRNLYKGKERKRYAKDMLNALNFLDERIIGPRLEKLTTSCRWTKRYKERVNGYPNIHVKRIGAEQTTCEACDLIRYCSYLVTLSGQAYDNKTLENDDFLQNDKQILVIGKVCASRTEVYHQLRHYKYFLYQRCIPFIDETEEDSSYENVDLALSQMGAEGFMKKEVSFLEGYLNEADYFQEERLN